MTSSYEGKDAHASAKRFQGRDGETAGFEVYGRGGMAGLQREVDPDAFSTEERGLAAGRDGVVWVDMCGDELRQVAAPGGAGVGVGADVSPTSMRKQFSDECDRRWATIERERRGARATLDHGDSQTRGAGLETARFGLDPHSGGDKDSSASGQSGFGTHSDDPADWSKAVPLSHGSRASAMDRAASEHAWPEAEELAREMNSCFKLSGSVDYDSQDGEALNSECEDRNEGECYSESFKKHRYRGEYDPPVTPPPPTTKRATAPRAAAGAPIAPPGGGPADSHRVEGEIYFVFAGWMVVLSVWCVGVRTDVL